MRLEDPHKPALHTGAVESLVCEDRTCCPDLLAARPGSLVSRGKLFQSLPEAIQRDLILDRVCHRLRELIQRQQVLDRSLLGPIDGPARPAAVALLDLQVTAGQDSRAESLDDLVPLVILKFKPDGNLTEMGATSLRSPLRRSFTASHRGYCAPTLNV
ncbi:MAG: hypothetical protein OXG27_00820 [Chloroflexi bacterium]|nr:hypothetical protein [Chloroflexota bacterium]